MTKRVSSNRFYTPSGIPEMLQAESIKHQQEWDVSCKRRTGRHIQVGTWCKVAMLATDAATLLAKGKAQIATLRAHNLQLQEELRRYLYYPLGNNSFIFCLHTTQEDIKNIIVIKVLRGVQVQDGERDAKACHGCPARDVSRAEEEDIRHSVDAELSHSRTGMWCLEKEA